jgi:hypothetical protein
MSRENVEMIARVLDQAQHNPAALWEILDDEVRWDVGALDIGAAVGGARLGSCRPRECARPSFVAGLASR